MKGLKLRQGIWHIDARVNGKRIRKSLGIPKECKKEAEIVAREFWIEVARGNIGIAQKNPALKTIFDNYVKSKGETITLKYREQIQGYFKRVMKELDIEFFTDFDKQRVNLWLMEMPTRRTAREIQLTVRAAFEDARVLDIINNNPLKDVRLLDHKKKKREPLTEREFIAFAKESRNYTCQYLLLFLLKTGCRFSEAGKAQWRQADLDNGLFILESRHTKTRQGRKIALTDDILEMLIKIRPENVKPIDLIFRTPKGTAFRADSTRKVVKKIGAKIDRPDITTHTLRHTFVTLCRDYEDVTLKDIGQIVGHSAQHTTRIYDHPSAMRQKRIAEKLPSLKFYTA